MPTLFKKKKPAVVPADAKLNEATLTVESQLSTFTDMADEVSYAMELRAEAMTDIAEELSSLELRKMNLLQTLEKAEAEQEADKALLKRVKEFYEG